jgi:hypothetical protein
MSEKIIIVLQGGVGNQLFQYCAGLALAAELGGELWLTPTQENKHSGRDYRELLYFRAKAIGIDGTPSRADVEKVQMDSFEAWTPSMYRGIESISLRGYYQYLPTIASQISLVRDDVFKRLTPLRTTLRQKYRLHNPRQTCFVHVRRGDYLKMEPGTFWVQGNEYFLEAVKAIKQRIQGLRRWFVISDDIAWCKEQEWISSFEIIDEPDELHGLMVMSMCEGGAVISNSTYSWWGAMLGCGASGVPVAYPSKWISAHKPKLFLPNWIRIEDSKP